MKPKVYIETSVVGYLTSRPSADLIVAAHQQITDRWWHDRRGDFTLYTSKPVLDEAGRGDKTAAESRLTALSLLPLLDIAEDVEEIAERLLREGPLPQKAALDAVHIATAAIHGMEYLLTWNCKHIANAAMRNKIEWVCRSSGCEPPILCTPEELLEA